MAAEKKDNWSTEAYQGAASFVPKLTGKILGWLNVEKDDVILDIGCGDGVLTIQIAQVLAQGSGSIHGIDSSPAMIAAAQKAAAAAGLTNCTFQVLDANLLKDDAALLASPPHFSKVFSNAALHWVLGSLRASDPPLDPATPDAAVPSFQTSNAIDTLSVPLFRAVRDALPAGGRFVFESGGTGNVCDLLAGIVAGVRSRIGLAATAAVNPWFFPDEAWVQDTLEKRVGGWVVERIEREYRPTLAEATTADGRSGVDKWIRLMARPFLDAIPDADEREACTREIVELLEYTTRLPDGRFNLNYVRLRVEARKL